MIKIESYDYLPRAALKIREEVFIKEQGFLGEFDETDNRATHLLIFQDEHPVGTCRYYWNEQRGAYVIGRVAVGKPWRGHSLGALMIDGAEKEIASSGGERVDLASQFHAAHFYEKLGYSVVSEPFYEEDCKHIWMSKKLKGK